MKKTIILASLIALGVLSPLTSCVEKENDDDDAVSSSEVTSVELKGLNSYYYPYDTIEWENVYLSVSFSNRSNPISLTKGEFDVNIPTSDDTEFILYTSGLYASSNNDSLIPEGSYDISYYFVYEGEEYNDYLTSISITNYPSSIYKVVYFSEPEFVTTYKDNVNNRVDSEDSTSEDSFYLGSEYTVGDDNPFLFKPSLHLLNSSNQVIDPDSYSVNVSLYLEDSDSSRVDVINDEEYVSYSDFNFQFTEKAIGHSFTISMSLIDFTVDISSNPIEPITFSFNVEDGYNAYTGLDLDMINAAPEDVEYYWVDQNKRNWYETYDTMISEQSILFDPDYKYTHTPYDPTINPSGGITDYPSYCPFPYVDVWNNFFTERGIEASYINGIYMHGDIKLSMDDFPDEYKISKEEAEYTYCYDYTRTDIYQRESMNYEEMIGSLRDKTILFNHFMEDDFTFNGNLFTLDCSDIRWCRTYATGEISSTPYYFAEDEDNNNQGGCFLFAFSGKFVSYNYPELYRTESDEEGETAYLLNLNAKGNLDLEGKGANFPRPETESEDSTNSRRAGTIMFCSSSGTHTVVDNVIAKEFLIGFYARHANEKYTCLEINHTKLYDTYAAGCYSYNGGITKISNSELKRFGAPALMAVSNKRYFPMTAATNDTSAYLKDGFGVCTYELDNVNIDNTLQGDEYFFTSYGITSLVPFIMEFDSFLSGGDIDWVKDILNQFDFDSLISNLELGDLLSSFGISDDDVAGYITNLINNGTYSPTSYGKTYLTEYTGTSGTSETALNALYTGMDEYITSSNSSVMTTDLYLDYQSSSGNGGFTIDYRNEEQSTDNLAYVIEQFYENEMLSLDGFLPLFVTNTGKIFTVGLDATIPLIGSGAGTIKSYLYDVKDALDDDTDPDKSMLGVNVNFLVDIPVYGGGHNLNETEGGLTSEDTELLLYYRYEGMAIAVVLELYPSAL